MKGIAIKFLKTVDIGQTRDLFAQFVAEPEHDPIIVTQKGRPIAVVQAVHGADVETISVSLNPQFQALMEKSDKRYAQEGGFSSEEIRRYFGLKPFRAKKAKKNNKPKPRSNTRAKQHAPQVGPRDPVRARRRSAAGD